MPFDRLSLFEERDGIAPLQNNTFTIYVYFRCLTAFRLPGSSVLSDKDRLTCSVILGRIPKSVCRKNQLYCLRRGQPRLQRKPKTANVEVFANLTPPLSFRSSFVKQVFLVPTRAEPRSASRAHQQCTLWWRQIRAGTRENEIEPRTVLREISRASYPRSNLDARDSVSISSAHRV